ncbi:hypothetical protein CRUP_033787 [Coryphaenoides rupestris]|nr:hypothetical protein CRUP_033787 [Coryphaenoides rupestris]
MAALVFSGVVFMVGSLVNLTALWVFALPTKRKNSVTLYMINVAAVDLVLILLLPFCMPTLPLWLFTLINADRYVAIVQRKNGRELRNIPKAVVACAGVWVMTLGGTAPLLFPRVARLAFFFLLPVCLMIGCNAIIVDNLVHGRASKLKPNVKRKSIRIIVTLIIQALQPSGRRGAVMQQQQQ